MTHELAFILAIVAVIVAVELIADRFGLPSAALLTVAGLVYALVPGPNIELDPHVVLTFVLPPLLYSAAINSSLLAIRRNLRPVISLSVALVLATALVVGWGMDLLVPGVTLAAGVALGAAVAPPDPVAALAIGRKAGLPPRLITLIEGEGLLNDATALTTLTVATSAAVSGGFSLPSAAGRFVLMAAGGLLVGIAVAFAVRGLRGVLHEPLILNAVSLATPFVAYLVGEELHVSGVLAVVVAGLMVGHDTPRRSAGGSLPTPGAVWRLVDFLLEGFVFLLIGQQLPPVVRGLSAYSVGTVVTAVAVTVGVVLLLRPLWLVLTQSLPRQLHSRLGGGGDDERPDRRLTAREVLVMSWAGTRGVISLAAIFTLPLTVSSGADFPARDLLLFCTFCTVLVTLIGQGLTFEPLVRLAGLPTDHADEARVRNEARAAAVSAALSRLDQLEADGEADADIIRPMREVLTHRADRYQKRIAALSSVEDGELPQTPRYDTAVAVRRAVIAAERDELVQWRDTGRLPDESLRMLERELDFEENVLPERRPST